MNELQLKHCTVELYPDTFCVTTRFPDGIQTTGQRLPSPENIKGAVEQGYSANAAGVWMAIAEHEIGHSLLWDWLYGQPSPTLRHVAEAEECPLHLRWFEESLVLSFQKWINTREMDQPLWPYLEKYDGVWRAAFQPYRDTIKSLIT